MRRTSPARQRLAGAFLAVVMSAGASVCSAQTPDAGSSSAILALMSEVGTERTQVLLVIDPERMRVQPAASSVLSLPLLVGPFVAPRVVSPVRRFTLILVPVGGRWEAIGVTEGDRDLTARFERLHGDAADTAGRHRLYELAPSAPWRVALLDRHRIVEGPETALRAALEPEAPGSTSQGRLFEVAHRLVALPDTRSPATLFYFSPEEDADLVQIISDLDWIWGTGLRAGVAPYQMVLRMLGSMRGARADVWEAGDELAARIVLVAPSGAAAKRSQMALSAGRQLGLVAAAAAVRTGSMRQADAETLAGVLESMRSHVEEECVHVELRMQAADLLGPEN
ncbi:MAG: hypothetical protein ACE5G2_06155 [Candidatus Krumholzibacteriia bacterium]